jgi:proline iminopeptidase
MVNDVELLRKHLTIDRWIVMGQSWATHTALLYGIKYPEHTSKIILQATAGTDNKFQEYYWDNIEKGLTEADKTKMEALSKDSTASDLDIFKVVLNGYFYDRTKSASFLDFPPEESPYFYNGDFFGAFMKDPGYESFDISKEAYNLDIPVRIIQGRQDPVNGGTQERLNERLKNSKIYYIERAGHFPWLEQPEAFFTALKESLKD